MKQLLNSVLVGYAELLRPRFVQSVIKHFITPWFVFVLFASALIIPHILLDLIQ